MQFILIEPDVKKLGWGIVKFCDLMQVSLNSASVVRILISISISSEGRRSGDRQRRYSFATHHYSQAREQCLCQVESAHSQCEVYIRWSHSLHDGEAEPQQRPSKVRLILVRRKRERKITCFSSRARQIKLSKIAGILEIPGVATPATASSATTVNSSSYLTGATNSYSQNAFGKDWNLIRVRNSPTG